MSEATKLIEDESHLLSSGDFKEITNIVLKARFANKTISNDELYQMEKFYKEFIAKIYSEANYVRKIYLKYIKVIDYRIVKVDKWTEK